MECSFWLSDFKRAQISSSFLHTPTPEGATPRPEGRRDHVLAGVPPCSRLLLFFNVINTQGSLPFRGGQTLIATNFPAAGLPLPLPPAPGGSRQAASGQAAVASEHGSCGWDSTAPQTHSGHLKQYPITASTLPESPGGNGITTFILLHF